MTITEFLLARIAEDEAGVDPGGSFGPPRPDMFPEGPPQRMDYDEVLMGPARVLAECEARRRIMDEHELSDYMGKPSCWLCAPEFSWGKEPTADEQPCRTLRALASVYAAHPDFAPAWRLQD